MSKCDVCINKKYCVNHLDARTMCPQMDYVLFTPSYKTNYDLLISKTPEEMAELIGDNIDCNICKEKHSADGCPRTAEKDCYGVWLDWLKSPVEVET